MFGLTAGHDIQKLIFRHVTWPPFNTTCFYFNILQILSLTTMKFCYLCSEVHFKHLSSQNTLPVRDVNASSIGKLVCIRGIVTRCTEVKPVVQVATYTCDRCGTESYQTVSCSF